MEEYTNSEKMFISYAQSRGYNCVRLIADGKSKSPDFQLWISSVEVICEISELRPIEVDKEHARNLKKSGLSGIYELVGRRLQNKIKEKKKQLEIYRDKEVAAVIVFASEPGLATNYSTPDDFQAAMYGLPRSVSPFSNEILGHGKRRLFTSKHLTYISALCDLRRVASNEFELCIFHNFYARVPLGIDVFSDSRDRHFRKTFDPANGPWGWDS